MIHTVISVVKRKFLAGAFRLLILALLAGVAAAASLESYHRHVETARAITDELINEVGSGNQTFEQSSIASLKGLIPPSEQIETPTGSIETDNRWLETMILSFEQETDPEKRRMTLTSVSERLLAISQSVNDLQTSIALARTKDSDKQKLVDILAREEYQKPQVKEDSLFQKWLNAFLEWLNRVFPRAPIEPGTAPGLGSLKLGLQILILALVVGLIGYLIYRFVPFKRSSRKAKREKTERVVLGERIGADRSAADLFGEAEAMALAGNLRSAIRKGYIALLCELSDRKLLGLAKHKTNRDYLRDVRKNPRLFENMTFATFAYESNWYGLHNTQAQDWEEFRSRYTEALEASR
jgi:Domain of unknown function (DUF4129)